MLVKVSIGEALDKYSILSIKKGKLGKEQQASIEKEMNELSKVRDYINVFPNAFWYSLLQYVNLRIWNLTNEIKSFEWSSNPYKFSYISYTIFELNQRRFRLKDRLNKLSLSQIEEEKSYAKTTLAICVNSLDDFYTKLALINEYSLRYDKIIFVSKYVSEIQTVYPIYPFSVTETYEGKTVTLNDLVAEDENTNVYEFPPLNYLGGGKLGDFILSLSVVQETFLKSGRKGAIFLSNRGDAFTYPLEKVISDTSPVLLKQMYIYSYELLKNQVCHVDLANWRNSNIVHRASWYNLYKSVYNIEWGLRPWLTISSMPDMANIICIHSSKIRINYSFDVNKVIQNNPNNSVVFLSEDDSEYEYFIKRTGLTIPFLKVHSFLDLCIAIQSCKHFIGNMSAPMAIADAMFKSRTGLFEDGHINQRQYGMLEFWKNVQYYN